MRKNMAEQDRPKLTLQYAVRGLRYLNTELSGHCTDNIRDGNIPTFWETIHERLLPPGIYNSGLLFHNNNSYENAPQCYVISILPV